LDSRALDLTLRSTIPGSKSPNVPSHIEGTSQPDSKPKTATSQKKNSENSIVTKSPSKATKEKSTGLAPIRSKTKKPATNSPIDPKSREKGYAQQQRSTTSVTATWRQPKWNFQADWGDANVGNSQTAQ